jgi:hypothetical protein
LLSYGLAAAVLLFLVGAAFWWAVSNSHSLSNEDLAEDQTPADIEINNSVSNKQIQEQVPSTNIDKSSPTNAKVPDADRTPIFNQGQASRQTQSAPPVKSPIISTIVLPLGSTRGAEPAKVFVLPEKTSLVHLQLKIENGHYLSYFAVVETVDGQQVWRGKALKSRGNDNARTVMITVLATRLTNPWPTTHLHSAVDRRAFAIHFDSYPFSAFLTSLLPSSTIFVRTEFTTLNYFNYYTEIEETFVRRRNKHLFLSPLDWALIEQWQERGIPLHIVIRSIESVFDIYDQQPPATRSIKSLFYCREEIEVQYEEWRRSQAGRSDGTPLVAAENTPFSVEAIKGHIDDAAATLKTNNLDCLSEDISRAVARLEELTANVTTDLETVDATLGDIEKLLDRAMLSNWDKTHLKTLEKEIAAQLRGYKSEMDVESYENTFQLMLLKRLREESGIPRLGLFYL